MGAYDGILASVTRMIARYGGPGQFIHNAVGVYDPSVGTATATQTAYPVSLVAFDFLQKKDGDAGQGNTLIRSGDKEIYMTSNVLLPRPVPKADSIIYTGRKYSIVTVKELNPSGLVSIVYQLFIRE